MTVRTRGKKLWLDVSFNNVRARHPANTTDLDEANRLDYELLYQLRTGTYNAEKWNKPELKNENITLRKAYGLMSSEIWEHQTSYKSFIKPCMEDVIQCLGNDFLLRTLDESHLQKIVNYCREKGNSSGTINRKLTLVRSLVGHAVEVWKVPMEIPSFKRSRQKEPKGKIRYISTEEEAKILKVLRSRPCRTWTKTALLVPVLIDTGCRISEILNLGTVEIECNAIRIWHTKTGKPRSVPLTKRAQKILRTHTFNDLSYQAVKTVWSRARKEAGMEDVRIHDLRHTCASRLLQGGMSIVAVRDWLGHTSIKTTEIYAHLAKDHLSYCVDALEEAAAT